MFAVGRGSDWVVGGNAAGEAAGEDYVKNRYHQPSDQYDPKWDWSGPVQEVSLYYRLGRMLAMAAARLGLKCQVFSPDPDSPAFDVVLISTAHKSVDYGQLAKWAPLIVDTRNAMAKTKCRENQVWKA